MGLNKLDKSICKGGKFNGREILGIKFNKKHIYETTGPSRLNIYKVYIPKNKGLNIGWDHQVTLFDRDSVTGRNSSNYKPTIYWGDGTSIKEDKTGKTFFKKDYAYKDRYYTIETTCELINNSYGSEYLPGDYIEEIVSIRADYLSGEDLFYGFTGIKTLSELLLQRLNTSVFSNMSQMFYNCNSLTELNLSSFNTGNVTTMSGMFGNCRSLISLDLSNFDTSNVTDMSYMFYNCTSLEELNLSNFDTSKVIRKGDYVPGLGNSLTDGLDAMLQNCTALHTLILDGCSKDTINDIITSAYFPTNEIANVIRIIYCEKEVVGDLAEPTNWRFSFNLEEEPEIPDVPVDPPVDPEPEEPEEPEIPLYQEGQFRGDTRLTEVVTMVDSSCYDLKYMFEGCTNLVSVNTQDWSSDHVDYMTGMFRNCSSITNIDLSTIRLDDGYYSVGAMDYMFAGCSSLETLDLRNFYINYYNVEEDYITRNMFDGCTSLRTLYLNNCDAFTIDQIIMRLPYRPFADRGVIYIKEYCRVDEDKEIYNNPPSGWRFEYVD